MGRQIFRRNSVFPEAGLEILPASVYFPADLLNLLLHPIVADLDIEPPRLLRHQPLSYHPLQDVTFEHLPGMPSPARRQRALFRILSPSSAW